MRILWLSNAPWAKTGYGVQTRMCVERLKRAGHDVAVQAFYGLQGGKIEWNGIPIYPRAYHAYGMDCVEANADDFRADLVITLLDAWVLEPRMMKNVRWCPWFPVDHEPLPERIRQVVEKAHTPLVFSRFGERMVKEAGLTSVYIPHGVETGVYFPVEQQAARRALGWGRLEDYWIVGMVAANKGRPSRKAFPQQLEAFARFHKRHPKSCLYIHSVIGEYDEEHGINLRVLVERLGLAGCVRFCEQYQNMLGYADEHMRLVYSALDILMNVSLGEGFGIPLVEAQACGCPVVTGGWTAMPELCWAGYCVHREMAEPWWTPLEAYQFVPHVDEIDAALELAWLTDEDERLELRARARHGALAYDADAIMASYWTPFLRGIENEPGGNSQSVAQ